MSDGMEKKSPLASKTLWFNLALALATVVLHALAGFDWVVWLGHTWSVLVIAAVNFALRLVTSQPIITPSAANPSEN